MQSASPIMSLQWSTTR
ncbi:TPA: hypothetical protein N0F65_004653 [Lagenidium giganteum]|uniref:Uncharacterized protein n=1 Tax=Lagenidium giganteum TaxID=4803 RepID=A0AAV2ZAQ0_9STRA|nr:TPA: hypothetical protein N0F65_004653 [Lagenidium giganteum]